MRFLPQKFLRPFKLQSRMSFPVGGRPLGVVMVTGPSFLMSTQDGTAGRFGRGAWSTNDSRGLPFDGGHPSACLTQEDLPRQNCAYIMA